MAHAVFLQAATTILAAAIAAVFAGGHAAVSVLFAGLACVVPNALFALRLTWEARRPGGATVHGFFIGEFAKLAATVVMLFAIARLYRDLDWLALVVGLIAVQHSYVLALIVGRPAPVARIVVRHKTSE